MFREKIFFEKMEIDNFIIMMNMIVIEGIIVIINNNNSLWALANYVLLYSKKRRIIIIGIPRAKGDTMPEGQSGFVLSPEAEGYFDVLTYPAKPSRSAQMSIASLVVLPPMLPGVGPPGLW